MFDLMKEMLKYIEEYQQKHTGKQVVIAIDGMCGAGKSTIAQMLHDKLGGNLFHMDDFFLQPYQRTSERLAEIGGECRL